MSTETEKKVPETVADQAAADVKMSPEMAAAYRKMIAAADEVERVVVGKRTEVIQLLTAMLAGAQQFTGTAQFQIRSGNFKAVVAAAKSPKPFVGLCHQETPALLVATANTSPQLMQLGKTIAICVLDDH